MGNQYQEVNTKVFIQNSKKRHGERYDYSLTEYVNAKTKVKVICREHGLFEVLPSNHYKKNCSKCSKVYKKTTGDFIKEATVMHGDRYDYSLTEFKNSKTNIKVICHEHGEFQQKPDVHLKAKHGCQKCKYESTSKQFRFTTEQFIEIAREKHGDLYDYSLAKYEKAQKSIKIICKKHGVFKQTPEAHMNGCHCRRCSHELLYRGWNEHYHFEPIVRDIFSEYAIEPQYPVEKEVNPKYNFLIDFAIPELNLAIEYDEKQHYTKENIQKDKFRQKYLEEKTGFQFIRVDDKRFMKEGKQYFLEVLQNNKINT